MEQAFGIFMDLYQYDALRVKYEPQIVTGMAYCLAFKFKDYGRANEMLKAIPLENRDNLSEFYKDLHAKTLAEIELNKDKLTVDPTASGEAW